MSGSMQVSGAVVLAGLAGLAVLAGSAAAAPITWGQPFEIVTGADIDVSGEVIYAINAGDNIGNEAFIPPMNLVGLVDPLPVVIGGKTVMFEGIETVYGPDAAFGMLGFPFETFGDAVDHLEGQDFNVTFATSSTRTVSQVQVSFDPAPATLFDPLETANYDPTTGNAALDRVLDSIAFYDGRGIGASALNITLRNLEAGRGYRVQLVGAADSRAGRDDRIPTDTVNDGEGNSMPGLAAYADTDGDGVKHVTSIVGEFTADGPTQRVNVVLEKGRNGGIAMVLVTAAGGCNAADLELPFGELNVFDIVGFFDLFGGGDPLADLAAPIGTLDVFDILGFFDLLGAGC